MPPTKYNEYYADETDPDFKNLTELYQKTSTTEKDWEAVRQDAIQWLKEEGIQGLKSTSAKDSAQGFITKLGRQYQEHTPPLFGGLDDEGIRNALYTVIQRVAYNSRRRASQPAESSPHKKSDRLSADGNMPTYPASIERANHPAVQDSHPGVCNVKAKWNGVTAKILLNDIASSANPPLEPTNAVAGMTIDIFVACWREDFGFEPSQPVELLFKYPENEKPTRLLRDRQLRAALQDVVEGRNINAIFEIVSGNEPPGLEQDWRRKDPIRSLDNPNARKTQTPKRQRETGVKYSGQGSESGSSEPPLQTKRSKNRRLLRGILGDGDRTLLIDSTNWDDDGDVEMSQEDGMPEAYGSLTSSLVHRAQAPAHATSLPPTPLHEPVGQLLGRNVEAIGCEGRNRSPEPKSPSGPAEETKSQAVIKSEHPTTAKSLPSLISYTTPGQGSSTGPAKKTEGQAMIDYKHESSGNKESGTTRENAIELMEEDGTANQAGSGHLGSTAMGGKAKPQTPDVDLALINRIRQGFEAAKAASDDKIAQRKKAARNILDVDDHSKVRGKDENTIDREENVRGDPDDVAREDLLKSWPSGATEHLYRNDRRWDDTCELFLLDTVQDRQTDRKVQIYGMNIALYPFQIFGVFVITEFEIFQNGGYLADDPGLGKTVEALAVVALNRVLVLSRKSVKEAREQKRYDLHLEEGTAQKPQPPNARCPSNNPYGIQCTCIDSGVSKKLAPSYGPNLILSPAGLMSHWLEHATKYLDTEAKGCEWKFRQAYSDAKMKKLALKLSQQDRDSLTMANKAPFFGVDNDRSMLLCFTTSGSYAGQVVKELSTFHQAVWLGRKKTKLERYDPWPIGWGRIIVDEVHREHNEGAGIISRLRQINDSMPGQIPRKILISGTPFESSPGHMAGWINTIQDKTWITPPKTTGYPRMHDQRQKLKFCTKQALIELGKKHESLVKAIIAKTDNKEARTEHGKSLTTVVQTLWLQRMSESTFFGYDMVLIPANYHFDCLLDSPERYRPIFDGAFDEMTRQLRGTFQKSLELFDQGKKITTPAIAVNTWLQAARRARILSSFPELALNEGTKDLTYTLQEIQANRWIKIKKGKLYELERKDSPYEEAIAQLAGIGNCVKMRAMWILANHFWKEEPKLVVLVMGPVPSLIVYWAIRLLWKKPVALISGAMPKSRVNDIIVHFQEGEDDRKSSWTDEIPQVIVGNFALLKEGHNLTAAQHVVLFDTQWMVTDEVQGIKRVSRVGQKKVTQTIKLVNKSSKIEIAIHDRQGARMALYKIVQAPIDNSNVEDRGKGEEEGLDNDDLIDSGSDVEH